jgi:hypothetical protein
MTVSDRGQLPAWTDQEMARREQLLEWWSHIRIAHDPGATTREVLGSLERQVIDCLMADAPRLSEAESATAKALMLIAGQVES